MQNDTRLIKAKMLYMQLSELPITPTMKELHQWLFDILWSGIINNLPGGSAAESQPVGSKAGSTAGNSSETVSAKPAEPTCPEYQTARYLYMKAKGVTQPPSLDELITWLCKRGSVDYSRRLRYTLDLINDEVMEFCPVAPGDQVTVTGSWIHRIATLTQSVPRRPRKKKKS